MFEKETQKKLKEEFRELLKGVWGKDERMIDFCVKKADILVKTEKGFFIEVEKPSIETSFCFGYSDSAYDTEDFDRANRMAHHAKTNEDYFREENLKKLKNTIDWYSDKNNELFYRNHYYRQENDKLKCIESFKPYEYPEDIVKKEYKEYVPVTEEERQLIVDAFKKELEVFSKRVETYLKRYGLSKVRTWSYWRDE